MCHKLQYFFSSSLLLFNFFFPVPLVAQTFLPFMNSDLPMLSFTSSGVHAQIGKDFKPSFQNTRRTDAAIGNSFLIISTPLTPNEPQKEGLRAFASQADPSAARWLCPRWVAAFITLSLLCPEHGWGGWEFDKKLCRILRRSDGEVSTESRGHLNRPACPCLRL